MIRLGLPKEIQRLTLYPGEWVDVRPLDTATYQAALATGWRKALDLEEQVKLAREAGAEIRGLPDISSPEALQGLSRFYFIQALARHGVVAWGGFYMAEGDEPAPLTPENLDEAMRIPKVAERFVELYTQPHAGLVDEGKDYAPAPNGSGARARDTVSDAGPAVPPALEAEEEGQASDARP